MMSRVIPVSGLTIRVYLYLIIMPEKPLSILYVDDEPLLAKVTKEYLETLGFIVETAESGIQALKKIADNTFDAIVSDYQMSKMNGITLLKEIRQQGMDVPFILFTGRGREEVVIEAIENGADFYLQKGGKPSPQFTELTHKIRTAVQQRKDAQALRESETRFRSLIQNSSDIIRIISKDGRIIFESASSKILGYPEGSLIGLNPFDFIHPEDQERVKNDFQEVRDRCNPGTPTEYRIRTADGTYLYVESLGLNLVGVPGIDGIVTTTHPVHKQKIAEIALLESEESFRLAFESAKDAIFWVDAHTGMIVKCNRAAEILLNKPGKSLIGTHYTSLHPPESSEYDRSLFENLLKGKSDHRSETVIVTSDGSLIPVQISASVTKIGNRELIQGIFRDISEQRRYEDERKNMADDISAAYEELSASEEELRENYRKLARSEQALSKSEALLRGLFDTMPSGASIYQVQNNGLYGKDYLVVDFNKAALAIEGKEKEEVVGKSLFDLRPNIDDFGIIPIFESVWRTGEPAYYPARFYSDEQYDNWYENYVFKLPSGEIVAIYNDVTEKMVFQERLEKSERQYRILTEGMKDVAWTLDPQTMSFLYVSQSVQHLRGYSPVEICSRPIDDALMPESAESIKDLIRMRAELFRSGLEQPDYYKYEIQQPCRDGTTVWTESVTWYALHEETCQVILHGISRDVTERKQMEDAQIFLSRCGFLLPGEDFFKSLARYLAEHLSMDCVYIAQLSGDTLSARTVAVYCDGECKDNIEYTLKDTPCGDLVGKRICCFPADVRHLFPKAAALQEMGAESYVGTTLWSYDGRPIGLIGVIGRKPLEHVHLAESILNLVAIRAGGELERRTAGKALSESEELYRSVFTAVSDGIFVIDQETRAILDLNDSSCRLYGYSHDELVGMKNYDVSAEPDKTILSTSNLSDRNHLTIPIRYHKKKDGTVFPVEISVSQFLLNNRKTILATVRDITERKQAEDALRQANRQLNLLSGVTRHDILNGINALQILIELINNKADISSFLHEFKNLESVTANIQSQIEFTRVYQDLGTNKPQWQKISSILIRIFEQSTVHHQICLEDIEVYADLLLERVFYNLLDNSLRHGRTVTTIQVSGMITPDSFILVWEDDGAGVQDMDKESIFERGFGKSSGMGLFFIREILSLTGITIKETGEVGKGARFEITVPKGGFRIHVHNE